MGKRDLAYKSIDQFPTSTSAPVSGDWILYFDTSADEWVKQNVLTADVLFDEAEIIALTVTSTATFSGATIADLGTVTAATFAGGTIADLGTVTTGVFTDVTIGTSGSTAAEIVRATDVSTRVVTLADTSLAVTHALHEGRIILLGHSGAASTATLPEATGSGGIFTFIVSVVNTSNHVIVCEGAGEYNGFIRQIDNSDDSVDQYPALVADNFDTITLNGTTQGGLVGDKITLIDIAADTWSIEGDITSTGSAATPFS